MNDHTERHELLEAVLTQFVPWVALAGLLIFGGAWLVSLISGDSDTPALIVMLGFLLLAIQSWAARFAVKALQEGADRKA